MFDNVFVCVSMFDTCVSVCVSVFYTCVGMCDRSAVAHSGRAPSTGNPAHIAGDVTRDMCQCVCPCLIFVLVCVTGQLLPTVVEHQALGILPTLLEMLHMCRCVCPCLTHVLVCVSVFYTCIGVCDRSFVAHSGRTPGTGNPAYIAGDVTHVLVCVSMFGTCVAV